MKTCTTCHEAKPPSEFYRSQVSKGIQYYRGDCKTCNRARARALKHLYPTKGSASYTPENNRKQNLKKCYGISPVQFDSMLASQGGCCSICKTTKPRGKGNFHVDHCHKTGRIRGLLCHSCNVGLGQFGDNVASLHAAINYLTTEDLQPRASLFRSGH